VAVISCLKTIFANLGVTSIIQHNRKSPGHSTDRYMISEGPPFLASGANSVFLLVETNGAQTGHATTMGPGHELRERLMPGSMSHIPLVIRTDHEHSEIVLSCPDGATRRVSMQGLTVGGDAESTATPESGTVELLHGRQREPTDRRVPTSETMRFMDDPRPSREESRASVQSFHNESAAEATRKEDHGDHRELPPEGEVKQSFNDQEETDARSDLAESQRLTLTQEDMLRNNGRFFGEHDDASWDGKRDGKRPPPGGLSRRTQ
jgi:hypothetical protein